MIGVEGLEFRSETTREPYHVYLEHARDGGSWCLTAFSSEPSGIRHHCDQTILGLPASLAFLERLFVLVPVPRAGMMAVEVHGVGTVGIPVSASGRWKLKTIISES